MTAPRYAALALLALAVSLTACGLKGPLTLPEKSGQVVVRGKPTDATSSGQPAPDANRLPPPELPRGNSGTQPNRP